MNSSLSVRKEARKLLATATWMELAPFATRGVRAKKRYARKVIKLGKIDPSFLVAAGILC